jgi:hypothetical protein
MSEVTIDHDDQPCPRCGATANEAPTCTVEMTIDQIRALAAFERSSRR